MIKKLLATLAISFAFIQPSVSADVKLDRAPNRINDMASLQNGAKLFVNYCLSCHAATSMRYNKLTDIGLTEEEIKRNLLFTTDKIGDLMNIAMTREDGTKWFGSAPPDLSVIARAKSQTMGASGVDYVYSFLRGFYRDASRTTGWDNVIFPSVGMPNVLWELQGAQTFDRTVISPAQGEGSNNWVRTTTHYDAYGFATNKSEDLGNYNGDRATTVKLTPADERQAAAFNNNVADLANFLGWMAEPGQQFRKKLGVAVLFFLGLFFVVAWRLNAVYWKNVK